MKVEKGQKGQGGKQPTVVPGFHNKNHITDNFNPKNMRTTFQENPDPIVVSFNNLCISDDRKTVQEAPQQKSKPNIMGFDNLNVADDFDATMTQASLQQKPNNVMVFIGSEKSKSDGESYSSDNESDEDITDFRRPSDSVSEVELSDQMCRLCVSDDKSSGFMLNDEDGLIARSPIRGTKVVREPPYSFDSLDSRRRKNLQNGGQIVAENPTCLNVPPQLFPGISSNVNTFLNIPVEPEPPQDQTMIVPGYGPVYIPELKKYVEEQLSSMINEPFNVSDDCDRMLNLMHANLPDEVNNSSLRINNIPENRVSDNVIVMNIDGREKSHTPRSDDSTYGSLTTSPCHNLSPYSSFGSPESSGMYSSVTSVSNSIASPSDLRETLDLNSLVDNEGTRAVYNPVDSNAVQFLHTVEANGPVINLDESNRLTSATKQSKEVAKSGRQLPSRNIYLSVEIKPVSSVVLPASFSSQKTIDKRIQPLGVVVYPNRIPATERLYKQMKTQKKDNVYFYQYTKDCLEFKDEPEKLKTTLFNFLKEKRNCSNERWLSILYAHIEFIAGASKSDLFSKKEEFINILTAKHEGMSLLYTTCKNHADLPIAARYIAETIVKFNLDINESYNDADGNSIIHMLAYNGDTQVELLAELLQVRGNNNSPVFNINCRNKKFQTPLHLAVFAHSSQNSCFTTVKSLLDNGAKILKDVNERTPLHYAVLGACEPNIVQKLLPVVKPSLVIDIQDYQGNTALHFAYANRNVPPVKQKEVISLLIQNKANTKILNEKGELPCLGMVHSSWTPFGQTSLRKQTN